MAKKAENDINLKSIMLEPTLSGKMLNIILRDCILTHATEF